MFSGLLIILLPLLVGYLLPVRHAGIIKLVHRLLGWMVYLILFFMGIGLAFLENLAANLIAIFHYSMVSVIVILLCNVAALWLLERLLPWHHKHPHGKPPSRIRMLLESLKLCVVVVAGFILGLSGWKFLHHASLASEYSLLFLMLLVGIQLRDSGMTVRQLVINRRGTLIAAAVVGSSLIAGVINGWILGLPLKTSLAMASGYGWYSLSGILMSESFGPVIGSATFFNDLLRELLAIMLVPLIIKRSPTTALGLCGATSMDFTLPVLQRSGGLEMVPAAVVHGFILSLLTPLMITFFSA